MGARREWIEHDYSRSIIVSRLQISLFQQGKTQTEPGFSVVRVFVEQVAKDLLSLEIIAFAHCPVALVVSLLVGGCDDSLGRTGAGKTKHEGGHTEGRHPRKTPRAISLHDSHFLSDRQLCAYNLLQDFSCLHGPENQIKLIEIYTDVASEPNQLLLNFEILPSCRRWFGCIDHSDFSQTSHHVLIKYRVTFHADVSQEVAGFLVT